MGRRPECGPAAGELKLGTTFLSGEASVPGVSFLNASSGPALHGGRARLCFGAAASGVCPRCTADFLVAIVATAACDSSVL